MGPMNNQKQLKVVTYMIAEARAAGQDVQELGQVPDLELYNMGHFQRPVLGLNANLSLSVVLHYQFGPILPFMPFETEADAIAIAKDDLFDLASLISTEDTNRAMILARQIEVGYTFINAHGPFGGFKKSGIGRNFGNEGKTQFQGFHSISGAPGPIL